MVTGATRNLGLALAQGLAQRLRAGDIVYLTGPDPARIPDALATVSAARAEVHGVVVDVAEPGAVARFAASLADRHGGVDVVFSNHYARVQPEDDPGPDHRSLRCRQQPRHH